MRMTMYFIVAALLVAALAGLAACQRNEQPPAVDLAGLRAELQEHTETLLLIHFKLDNARQEIEQAESRATAGECDVAGYHAADAYRELQAADEMLLDLGQQLQKFLDLDASG